MDWQRMVEWNAKRLQRILAALMAMAGRPEGGEPG